MKISFQASKDIDVSKVFYNMKTHYLSFKSRITKSDGNQMMFNDTRVDYGPVFLQECDKIKRIGIPSRSDSEDR